MVISAELIPKLEQCLQITAEISVHDEAALQIFERIDRELMHARSLTELAKISDPIARARELSRIRRAGA